mmetsp:Transcript_34873/g.76217  ORF Transcript_34873/g.76217 Transcript_34873/m.76217 type:complete len:425 (+) Transcript_34873:859-2133(+)
MLVGAGVGGEVDARLPQLRELGAVRARHLRVPFRALNPLAVTRVLDKGAHGGPHSVHRVRNHLDGAVKGQPQGTLRGVTGSEHRRGRHEVGWVQRSHPIGRRLQLKAALAEPLGLGDGLHHGVQSGARHAVLVQRSVQVVHLAAGLGPAAAVELEAPPGEGVEDARGRLLLPAPRRLDGLPGRQALAAVGVAKHPRGLCHTHLLAVHVTRERSGDGVVELPPGAVAVHPQRGDEVLLLQREGEVLQPPRVLHRERLLRHLLQVLLHQGLGGQPQHHAVGLHRLRQLAAERPRLRQRLFGFLALAVHRELAVGIHSHVAEQYACLLVDLGHLDQNLDVCSVAGGHVQRRTECLKLSDESLHLNQVRSELLAIKRAIRVTVVPSRTHNRLRCHISVRCVYRDAPCSPGQVTHRGSACFQVPRRNFQ